MIIPKGTRPMSWRSGSEGNVLCDKFQLADMFLLEHSVETVCCLYHQKKDFISVPYEPKDANYLQH